MTLKNRNLEKTFIKGKRFKMNCYSCYSDQDYEIIQKRKVMENEDKSICYAITSECTTCKSLESFFINFYEKDVISKNIISY